jgi:hypothetical protein
VGGLAVFVAAQKQYQYESHLLFRLFHPSERNLHAHAWNQYHAGGQKLSPYRLKHSEK